MTRNSQSSRADDGEINTIVDDETFAELDRLVGHRVIYVHIWDDTVADIHDQKETSQPDSESHNAYEFDVDLYLEEGVFFELYAVLYYADPEEEPLTDGTAILSTLRTLVRNGLWLDEIAVDEEDGLVLLLGHEDAVVLYLVVGAWTLDEWTELPNDTDNT